jgi:hypothetical protein
MDHHYFLPQSQFQMKKISVQKYFTFQIEWWNICLNQIKEMISFTVQLNNDHFEGKSILNKWAILCFFYSVHKVITIGGR